MSNYHQTITIMPNGNIYGSTSGEEVPTLQGKILGNIKKIITSTGLVAKRKDSPNGTLGALLGKIATHTEDLTDIDGFIKSLGAATSIGNADNLTHLQLIRLFPEAQGIPDEYFWLDNAYITRDIPNLQFRETFYDTTATARYYDRLEESKATVTKYDEIEYNLRKLSDNVYTPIEDILRTIINPQELDLSQIRWGMKYKRNLEALRNIKLIGNTQTTLGSPADIGSSGFHSTNRTADEVNAYHKEFLLANDVSITHHIMSPTMRDNINSNTFTKGGGPTGLAPGRVASGGVFPSSMITGITDIVDPSVDDDVIYAINKPNALRLGEGPKMMKRYEDNAKDAEAIKVIDFNQYIAVNDQLTKVVRKYGMIIPFAPPT